MVPQACASLCTGLCLQQQFLVSVEYLNCNIYMHYHALIYHHVILNTHAYTKCPPRKRQSNLDQETHREGCLNQCKNGISKHYCLVLKYWQANITNACALVDKEYWDILRHQYRGRPMLPLALEPSGHMQGICRAELAAHVSAASRCPRRPHAKNMQKKSKTPKWGVHKDFKWFHIDLMDAFGNTCRQPQLLQPLKFHRQAQAWQNWQRFHSIRKHSIIFIILCFNISAVVISWCFA